TTKSRRYSR
ncbi:putative replication protein, partial [Escherichia coli FDA504]